MAVMVKSSSILTHLPQSLLRLRLSFRLTHLQLSSSVHSRPLTLSPPSLAQPPPRSCCLVAVHHPSHAVLKSVPVCLLRFALILVLDSAFMLYRAF